MLSSPQRITGGYGIAMRLRHIEVFRAVMLTGTASEAARMLSVSQPAVSRALQHAEVQLGFKLFQRHKGRLQPTPEAEALFANVSRVFRELDQVQRISGNLRGGGAGRIRVAATPSLSQTVLPAAASDLLRRHPDANCDIATHHSSQIIAGLLAQEIDLGFAFDPVQHEGVTQENIGEGELVALTPRRRGGRAVGRGESIRLAELVRERFIALHDDTSLGYMFNQACDRAGVTLRSSVTVQTYHLARTLVESGMGCSVVDQYTAVAGDPQLLRVQIIEPRLRFDIRLLRKAHRPMSVLARSMVDCMKRAEAETRARLRSWLQ
jgi:DNA-binding transcriptional LysR family regulator